MSQKFIEVKEYDTIICKEGCSGEYTFLDEKHFKGLENFIKAFSVDDETSDVVEFMKLGYKRGLGHTITLSNYVGLIQTDRGFQVQVLPKIDLADENSNQTKKIFLHMLQSMKDFPCRVFNYADLQAEQMNLYEIFINMYIQEVWHLVKHGLKSDYIEQRDNLNFFKGKLLFEQHIKDNIIHKEKFYVAYDEFQVNRSENRLIKATLLKLLRLSDNNDNIRQIRQLLAAFETVEPSVNYAKDFSKVIINRSTVDYEALMKWSGVFLQNKSFTAFSGKISSKALLFPMEKVFEAYVAKSLKKIINPTWRVSVQDRGGFLFDEPKRFRLIPDIVITKSDNTRVIMDTKWKRLYNNPRRNYGISQNDMYRMFAYASKYNISDVWLLYPATKEMRGENDITYRSQGTNENEIKVKVFFVELDNIENSLKKLMEKL